ncbi:MAG: helix-turn-helix transcriptional regulator [Lachnospiraceae bacterium]|jgi:transcriptional regulator with XRE-family HTH domain|nr:helix-turn-helix transcriptional regulator [Lachnospiraceae bacterium]MCI9097876.1 helix-turn-helix transcriptional regulator [Lachnospiraceae bacterium]
MTVAENIKCMRKEKGLTQKQLGQLCSPPIAESTIRQYELGLRHPKLENLRKISKALGIPYVGELLGDDFPEYKNQLLREVKFNFEILPSKTRITYDDEDDEKIEELYYSLNDLGRKKAVEHLELLTKIPEYLDDTEIPEYFDDNHPDQGSSRPDTQ